MGSSAARRELTCTRLSACALGVSTSVISEIWESLVSHFGYQPIVSAARMRLRTESQEAVATTVVTPASRMAVAVAR